MTSGKFAPEPIQRCSLARGNMVICCARLDRAGGAMPINYRINDSLRTDANILVDAFGGALKKLVVDRRDPEALVVAKHLISIAKAGERDPARLRDLTVQAVRIERRRSRAAIPGQLLRSFISGFWATHLL
jgi:hypothetical protein